MLITAAVGAERASGSMKETYTPGKKDQGGRKNSEPSTKGAPNNKRGENRKEETTQLRVQG